MKYFLFLVLIIFLNIYPPHLYAEESHINNHIIAAELSILGRTDNFEDPYSLPAGFGILYEYRGFNFPLILGVETGWYGFVPLNSSYEESSMIVPSVTAGYSFIKYFSDSSSLHLTPSVSAGQYFRTFKRNDTKYKGSNPIIKSGIDIMLATEKNMIFTIGLFYTFIMDNAKVSFPGYRNRIGYAF